MKKKDNKEEKLKQKKLFYIALSTIIYVIILYFLSKVDRGVCDGSFGALSHTCNSTNYLLWCYCSIPLVIFCTFGSIFKLEYISMIGTILYLALNLLILLFGSIPILSLASAIYTGILLKVELSITNKEKKKTS